MVTKDKYLEKLQTEGEAAFEYYLKSLKKTEQQKALEAILDSNPLEFETNKIADIACGAGTLSYHLRQRYPGIAFHLLDYYEDIVKKAQEINGGDNVAYYVASLYETPFADNTFDAVFCWQTLLVLEKPEDALRELVRITRPGGRVFLSSLFNRDKAVDILATIYDYTRESGQKGIPVQYNTYCEQTVSRWLKPIATDFIIHPFDIEIDLPDTYQGIGTYTVKTEDGKRLQISGGLLMNWGILEIRK